MDYWSYCVLTPTLKSNCDFTLAFAQFAILPLTFEWEASVYLVLIPLATSKI